MAGFELAQFVRAGVHVGHQVYRWNPKMYPYIYTETEGIHILDLVQTLRYLRRTCKFVHRAAAEGKTFLFVGTKPKSASVVSQQARRCNSHYINYRWLGGMLTNWTTFTSQIKNLKLLEKQELEGRFELQTKKEAMLLRKKMWKLKRYLNGVKEMKQRPDILIAVNQKQEIIAIKEALKLKIPIISIMDTNCDPDLADYIIPGNDDARSSVKLILEKIVNEICLGQRTRNFTKAN
uniref:ribosomal protein S2 n=1 Tax=Haramonas pauciplastida TaxID=478668 RepID=UPI00211575BF|nr:ribosomal protein S2 [Haramonas pauciplastida]UTE95003.1 ribosomal protein S2 [Haramonas pauciplastida]